MQPDLEQLRKNYENFDEDEIRRLATEQAPDLRPEALQVLRETIKKRGLRAELLDAIDVQLLKVEKRDLTLYIELIRKLPCPICQRSDEKLNATIAFSVTSFIIMTSYRKQLYIACPVCLKKQNNDAIFKSAFLGWWAFPWGVLRTVQSFFFNSDMKKNVTLHQANETLVAFVHRRIGRIEEIKNNPVELSQLITHIR